MTLPDSRPGGGHRTHATLARTPRWMPAACIVLALAGCTTASHDDLRAYVDEVKARQRGHVAPLPEVRRYESFAYAADDMRDPFVATFQLERARPKPSANGIRPDTDRKPEALEAFSLDSLALVGQLEKAGERWALISAPDGTVHRIQDGNHLGRNYGKVVAITDTQVKITEIVPDGLGGWIKRPASMTLNEE